MRHAVLLPGLLSDGRAFGPLPCALPGTTVATYGDARDLATMAERVLASAPPQFVAIGHSMGARVALEVVRRAPERVIALALLSTGIHPPRAGEAEKRHALRDLGRRDGMDALVDAWLPPMVAAHRRDDAALMDPLRAMCLDMGLDLFEAQIAALLARPEVEALLPAIGCPTLVACGALDAWSPPDQHRDIAARVAGARLAIVPDAGHMMPAEAPDAVLDLVGGWIADTDATFDTDSRRRGQ